MRKSHHWLSDLSVSLRWRLAVVCALALVLGSSALASVGPFEVVSRDSSTVLRLQLASQLQTAWESKDKGPSANRDVALYMRARRIRPTLTVSVPEYKTDFRLHVSMAPGSIELMDLYFNTKLNDRWSVRVGQYKIPFTRYRIQSFQRLTFVDWSIVTKYFGAERQLGISMHNGYEKPPRIAYAFGVFSGVNARASHATGLASVYGEKVLNPSDLSGSATKSEFHPELVAHVGYNAGGIDLSTDSDKSGGGLRWSVAGSVAWDIDPIDYQDLALRLAPELLVKYRHLSMSIIGYTGFVSVNGTLRTRTAMTGALGQAAYRVGKRLEFSFRYAYVDIDDAIADEAYGRGKSIIAATDDPALKTQYKDAGKVLAEHECTIGWNIYLDEHNFKIQNDIGFDRKERRDHNRTDYLVRSQVQFAF